MATSTPIQDFTVKLHSDVIDIVHAKVSSGEYASETDFVESAIVGSLLPPLSSDGLSHWIATEGVRRYDAMKADPSRGRTPEEVLANLGIAEDEESDAA